MNTEGMKDQEAELIRAVARGDREAFRQVYDHTYGRLASYVRHLVKEELLAEDIVVQTYTVFWQSAGRFRGEGRVTTWLIGIARNIAFKELRKKGRETVFDEAYCGADTMSHRLVEHNDRKKLLKEVLLMLSLKHREVLELVFYQGLNYQEVATLVDIPVNTVKTRVFHAKQALKDTLARMGIDQHDI